MLLSLLPEDKSPAREQVLTRSLRSFAVYRNELHSGIVVTKRVTKRTLRRLRPRFSTARVMTGRKFTLRQNSACATSL